MFVVKIPKEFQSVQFKTIIPIPNTAGKEITAEIENVFEYKNVTYKFEEAKTLNELQISKHCIYLLNCELIKNSITEIFQIDEETILIKNANGIELNQNCDNRKIKLKSTTLMHYNNCTIKILYQTFSNTSALKIPRWGNDSPVIFSRAC